jgi:hypothetical protein
MNALLQSLQQNPLWLLLIGVSLLIIISIAFMYSRFNSLRSKKRRELAKLLKAHVDEHYRQFDGHMWDLERELHTNLQEQLKMLRSNSAIPSSIRPAQSDSATTD